MYHRELAKQVADVLSAQSRLQRMGGLVTLTDLYCLLNRARGSQLVSPDDLLQSCKLLGHMAAGMYLRRFSSGLLAVQSEAFDEDGMCTQILALAARQTDGGIFATQVASTFHMSLVVASNHLEVAVIRGSLCVDRSRRGTRYFENRFDSYVEVLTAAASA